MGKKDSDYSTASDSDSDASYDSKKGKKDKKGKDKDKKEKKDKKDKKEKKDKDKSDKGKKDKDKREKDKDKSSKEEKSRKKSPSHSDQYPSSSSASNPSHLSGPPLPSHSAPPPFPGYPTATSTAFAPQPTSSHYNTTPQHPAAAAAARMSDYPPQYGESPAPPPSGYRIPLSNDSPFPESFQSLTPVAHDLDGSPIFLGSALMENAVHPCKIGPNLFPHAMVAYGGVEIGHEGRYDMLPFVEDQMEWVPAANGRIPQGRRPVEGGYEEGGDKLYHSIAVVNGVRVPGKTGEHLGGANVGFGGQEYCVPEGYEILCWRY